MKKRNKQSQSLRAIFAWPTAIFLLGIVGLVVALTGDGWRDGLSWLGLASPVTALVWARQAQRR